MSRVLVLVLVLFVVGVATINCGGEDCEQPLLLCGPDFARVCGNNAVDVCSLPEKEERCSFREVGRERCDGPHVARCSELGYYDGETVCVDCQAVDTTACRACASGALACEVYPQQRFAFRELVANGSRVVAVSATQLRFLEGTTLVRDLDLTTTDVIAIPDAGFLVASREDLIPLSLDGTGGPLTSLPAGTTPQRLAYGPNNRVLVLSRRGNQLVTAIADPTGALLTPHVPLTDTIVGAPVAVAADTTQFLVGHGSTLYRIGPDNTLLGTTTNLADEPKSSPRAIVWDGTAAWFIAEGKLQQLTATGAPVGPRIPTPSLLDATAGTNKLLVLSHEEPELVVRAYSSTTTDIPGTTLGMGPYEGAIVQVNDQVLAMWNVAETRSALVAAP